MPRDTIAERLAARIHEAVEIAENPKMSDWNRIFARSVVRRLTKRLEKCQKKGLA